MKRLIVNADDFGIHALVDEGIIKGHKEGIITSTSLLAGGDHYNEAIRMAKQNPGLGIGIHTALVGGLKPLSNPRDIPSLLTEEGLFVDSHIEFLKRLALGKINFNEVYAELSLQFEKILSSPLKITHVDGHQHLHVLPPVLKIVIALMQKHKLTKLRIPEEKLFYLNGCYNPVRFAGKAGLSHYAHYAKKTVEPFFFSYPRYFWGMINGGNMNQSTLLSILNAVAKKDGAHEIMVHPGIDDKTLGARYQWGYHWAEELEAVTSKEVQEFIRHHNIQLINYSDLT